MDSLRKKVLVLNKSWNPVHIITVKRAINLIFSTYKNGEPKAFVVDSENFSILTLEEWKSKKPDEICIRTTKESFKIPEIIILNKYNKYLRKIPYTKKNLLKRDEFCQYCGSNKNLTTDHIVPKSKGGKSSWLNCVICCFKCNSKKGNKSPEEAGLTLIKQPIQPSKITYDNPPTCWLSFINKI